MIVRNEVMDGYKLLKELKKNISSADGSYVLNFGLKYTIEYVKEDEDEGGQEGFVIYYNRCRSGYISIIIGESMIPGKLTLRICGKSHPGVEGLIDAVGKQLEILQSGVLVLSKYTRD